MTLKSLIFQKYIVNKYPDLNTDKIWDESSNEYNNGGYDQLLSIPSWSDDTKMICGFSGEMVFLTIKQEYKELFQTSI